MTFDDFHSHANIQGIPLAALRTYFEAGRLSGCMEKLAFLRKEFEDRGLVPWSKELNYPPDNFEQCGVESRNAHQAEASGRQATVDSDFPDMVANVSGESKKPGENQVSVARDHCSKIIPAQFVQHGRLESESYPAKNPSKGPPKIKKWMVR